MLSLSRFVLIAVCVSALSVLPLPAHGQENTPQSILIIEGEQPPEDMPLRDQNITLISSGTSVLKASRSLDSKPLDSNAEVVRDRYSSGKVHVERTVVLDSEGNYSNQGDYREYTEKGDLAVTGSYYQGKREGVWARFLNTSDAKLLSSYPFNKYRAPFSSSVEFAGGKMNGMWVISDRDKRIVMQIELRDGVRHGSTTLFHPNGQIYQQSTYETGLLNGAVIEKNSDGKVVSEDLYTAGQKIAVETERYPKGQVKSVMRYLTAPAKASALDDWTTTTLATYNTGTGRQLHGEFINYHDNGQIAAKGTYEHGKLHGSYESWYRTGEIVATGQYEQGQQVGDWQWRHPNGMKKAVATYVAGKPQGETRAWDESGKAVIR